MSTAAGPVGAPVSASVPSMDSTQTAASAHADPALAITSSPLSGPSVPPTAVRGLGLLAPAESVSRVVPTKKPSHREQMLAHQSQAYARAQKSHAQALASAQGKAGAFASNDTDTAVFKKTPTAQPYLNALRAHASNRDMGTSSSPLQQPAPEHPLLPSRPLPPAHSPAPSPSPDPTAHPYPSYAQALAQPRHAYHLPHNAHADYGVHAQGNPHAPPLHHRHYPPMPAAAAGGGGYAAAVGAYHHPHAPADGHGGAPAVGVLPEDAVLVPVDTPVPAAADAPAHPQANVRVVLIFDFAVYAYGLVQST